VSSVLPESAEIRAGRLTVGGVAASDLAAGFGTPLYVYCEATLRSRARAYREALGVYPAPSRVVFACKANSTVGVLRVVLEEGLGADVASEGELALALAAGADGEGLIVHGNNKSDADLAAALAAGAGLIVADHPAELDQIDRLAAAAGREQAVLVRVTPGIDAATHWKISTGHAESKFGFTPADAMTALERAAGLPHLVPAGLHVHLGSQIADLGTFADAVAWLGDFVESNGLGELPVLDVGGGLAIAHVDEEPAPAISTAVDRTTEAVMEAWLARGMSLPELVLEPGRSIAGPAGITLYTVGAITRTASGATYAAVDGGMSDNPRPALYGARYQALVVDRADAEPEREYTIAGKHCESGDVLIESVRLPELRPGDVLAVPATGAYTASMASNYNALPRAAAVMVASGTARQIVRRETVADLVSRELAG
jgi:diaminopimelate decarboxylase